MKWLKAHARKINLLGMYFSCLGYTKGMKKIIGQKISERLIIYQDKIFTSYDSEKDNEWLEKLLVENYRKGNLDFFRKIIKQFSPLNKKLINISNQIYRLPLNDLSNQRLAFLLQGFGQATALLFPYILLPRKIDEILVPKVENDFLQYLPKNLQSKGKKYFNLTLVPQIRTAAKTQEAEILKLALEFKKQKITKINLIKLRKENPRLSQLFEKHYQKYNWLGVYFCGEGEPLNRNYYLATLDALIQDSTRELKAKLSAFEDKHSLQKIKLPKNLGATLRIIKEFSVAKIKTGELWSFAGFQLLPLLDEIASRAKLSREEVHYLLPEEIIDFLLHRKKLPVKQQIKRRMKFSILAIVNGKIKLYESKTARSFYKKELRVDINKLPEIIGQVAYLGKVTGKVKIVFGKEEIKKFKAGEILVTGMTSVDFLPVVKKAKAIITDEGGITCHAAIITRELKKPCVIGTKFATQVFKDGDRVEVDADKGIVRKL